MTDRPPNSPRQLFRLLGDVRGTTLVTFAVAAPLLLMAVAAAIESVTWYTVRQKLRNVADASALAAAKELTLANRDTTTLADVAKRITLSQLSSLSRNTPVVDVAVADDRSAITVTLSRSTEPLMGNILPALGTITVQATARVSGRANVCAVGLDDTGIGAIYLAKSARITAEKCSIYSNSTNKSGLWIRDAAVARATLLCSAGGYYASGTPDVLPQPTVDCPKLADPLATRPEPAVGTCSFTNKVVSGKTELLMPGTYCGGLTVTDGANVTLASGTYVLKDGPLLVTKASTFKGTNVGFFIKQTTGLIGPQLRLEKDSVIDLTAPKTGEMAGILFFESRGNKPTLHMVTSDNARVLLGTFYLPVGTLYIDAEKPVADLSAYTVIVAKRIVLDAGPDLHLNANYGLTDIPVPKGLGPIGGAIKLVN